MNVQRRSTIIAGVLTALILVLLAAERIRKKFEVPPMPPEMECVVKHNCSIPDFIGSPAPPTAPPLPENGTTPVQRRAKDATSARD
jgi:hypothetical protein